MLIIQHRVSFLWLAMESLLGDLCYCVVRLCEYNSLGISILGIRNKHFEWHRYVSFRQNKEMSDVPLFDRCTCQANEFDT